MDEGVVNYTTGGYVYEYHLKDHLGNVRLVFKPTSTENEILQGNDYYAFGLRHLPVTPENDNKYLYNGKEIQEGTGWYDYGARMYDPALGRWHVVDPLATMYLSASPYNYTANNPIKYIDPDGRSIASTHTDSLGRVIAIYDDGDNGIYRHMDASTQAEVDEKRRKTGKTSGGGQWVGETEHWDEFVYVDKYGNRGMANGNYKIIPEAKIEFDNWWDEVFENYLDETGHIPIWAIGVLSRPNGRYDIKRKYGEGTGRLFNGYYITARSLGNYMVAFNSAINELSYEDFMRIAGGLHQEGVVGAAYSTIFKTTYGDAPFFGENDYCGRMTIKAYKDAFGIK